MFALSGCATLEDGVGGSVFSVRGKPRLGPGASPIAAGSRDGNVTNQSPVMQHSIK